MIPFRYGIFTYLPVSYDIFTTIGMDLQYQYDTIRVEEFVVVLQLNHHPVLLL